MPKLEWEPRGIELLDIKALYSDSLMEQLEQMCADRRSEPEAIQNPIINIAGWLNAFLHNESRPTSSQLRNGPLRKLRDHLERVQLTLDELDSESRRVLLDAATVYTEFDERLNLAAFAESMDVGRQRVGTATEQIEQMHRWASRALASLPVPKGGRPAQDAKTEAVQALAELWRERTGSWPTRRNWDGPEMNGPFNRFCAAALAPVLAANDQDTYVDHAVRTVLVDVEKTRRN